MTFILNLLKGLGRLLLGLLVFVLLAVSWTAALYVFFPWTTADTGHWPDRSPVVVTSGATGNTHAIPFRELAKEAKADPSLVPWPSTATGNSTNGEVRCAWKTASGGAWQFEVACHVREYVWESRYRLDGESPVLAESRVRGPSIAFRGAILAVITLIAMRIGKWWRRRRAATVA